MSLPPLWAALAGVLLGLGVATLCGWTIGRMFMAGLTGREKFAWSFAIGLMVQALALLVVVAVGARPTTAALLGIEAGIGIAALLAGILRRRAAPGWFPAGRKFDALAFALAAVAGAAWALFLLTAIADAPWATDFFAVWGYKAKIVYGAGSVPRRLFADPALDFAHPEYPLLVPLSLSALGVAAGRWNEPALALFYPACALATLLALWGFLARRVSRPAGALAAALSALCFFLYRPSNVGTAEIPFALAAVLAAVAASDFVLEASAGETARLAAAALFAASVKQEGALLSVLLAAAVWGKLRTTEARRARNGALALVLPVALHGVLQVVLRGHRPSRDFDLALLSPGRWGELPARFGTALARLLSADVLPASVPLLAIVVLLIATERGAVDWLLGVLALQLLGYVAAFTLSAYGPAYAVDAAFSRIATTLFPALTLVLAARLMSSEPAWAHQTSPPAGMSDSGESSGESARRAPRLHGVGTTGNSRNEKGP